MAGTGSIKNFKQWIFHTLVLLVFALGTQPAHAQWTTLPAPGQATRAVAKEPTVLAIAKSARILAVGHSNGKSVAFYNPDTAALLGTTTLPKEPIDIVLSDNGATAYALYESSGIKIAVINTSTRAISATWSTTGSPVGMVLNGTELLVADSNTDRLVGISTVTTTGTGAVTAGAVTRTKTLSKEPQMISIGAASATASLILVGVKNGELQILNASTLVVNRTVAVGDDIRSLAWWEGGVNTSNARVLAVGKNQNALNLVDPATGAIVRVALGGDPNTVGIEQHNNFAYVGEKSDQIISMIDLINRALSGYFTIPGKIGSMLFDQQGELLFVTFTDDDKLLKLDPNQASLITKVGVPKTLIDVAARGDTNEVIAISNADNDFARVNLATGAVQTLALPNKSNKVAVDTALNVAIVGATNSKLSFVNLATNPVTVYPQQIDLDGNIKDMAADPTRNLTIAVVSGKQSVRVINNITRTEIAAVTTNDKFIAVAIHPGKGVAYLVTDNKKLAVFNLTTRLVTQTISLTFDAEAIAVDPALNRAVLTTHDNDKAWILNLDTLQMVTSLAMAQNPGAVDIQTDTHIAVVASKDDDSLSLINLNTNIATLNFNQIDKPTALAISKRFNEVLVVSADKNDLAIIQLSNPVATLASIAPATVNAGAAATTITLTGANFIDGAIAYFGANALTTTWVSNSSLTAIVPAALITAVGSNNIRVLNPPPAGGYSATVVFMVGTAVPVLDSVNPVSVTADNMAKTFTLMGSNFIAPVSVVIATINYPSTTSTSTTAQVTLPASLFTTPGTLTLAVKTNGGTSASKTVTINPPAPTITSIAPISLTANSMAQSLMITGTNFIAPVKVRFDGTLIDVTPTSATQLSVSIPGTLLTTVKTVSMTVETSGGNSNIQMVPIAAVAIPAPTITSFTPINLIANSAAQNLTINGTNFIAPVKVRFDGTLITVTPTSATALTVSIPGTLLTTAKTVAMTVEAAGGVSNVQMIPIATVVIPAPTLALSAPLNLIANSIAQTLTLTGTNFIAPVKVRFDGTLITVTPTSATQLTVSIPGTLLTTIKTIALTIEAAGGISNTLMLNIVAPPPTFVSNSPTTLKANSTAQTLQLTGTNFIAPVKVRFDSTLIDVTPTSATTLTVTIPDTLLTTVKTVSITIEAAGGISNARSLNIITPPQDPYLYSSAPATLLALGQAIPITLSGQYFISGATVLLSSSNDPANTVPTTLTANFINVQQLKTTLPAANTSAAATLILKIQNPDGGISNEYRLPVTAPALVISAIAPAIGTAGSTVTIYGTGFSANAADNVVTFTGNAVGTIQSASTTSLTVTVPGGAQSGAIQVAVGIRTVNTPTFTVGQTPTQDFAFGANAAQIIVYQGSSTSVDVQLNNAGSDAYTNLAKLAVTGAAGGITATPSRPYLSNGQAASIVLRADAAATVGTTTLTVTATGPTANGNATKSATVNVEVRAKANVTGVKGRFVDPNGVGIGGVLVRYDTNQVQTDSAGNFLLVGLPAGNITLRFDATPAHPLYPIWPLNVDITQNVMLTIPDWQITPPPSDDKFIAINNLNQDQQITDARYPGFAITLPAGVSITGWDGVKKTRIAVERLAADKLGVPMPPVPIVEAYQLYFGTPMGGIPSEPIPITMPNVVGLEPGDQTQIWYFDGSPMGGEGTWKVAGMGTVSADGKTVTTNPGAGIPRFCGKCGLTCVAGPDPDPNPPNPGPDGPPDPNGPMGPAGPAPDGPSPPDGPEGPTPPEPPQPGPPPPVPPDADPKGDPVDPGDKPKPLDPVPVPPCAGNPVNLITGTCSGSVTEISLVGLVPVDIARRFSPIDAFNKVAGTAGSMGLGWVSNYDIVWLPLPGVRKRLVLPGNIRIPFFQQADGSYSATQNPNFGGSKFVSVSDGWELRFDKGATWHFGQYGPPVMFLDRITGKDGNVLSINRNSAGRMTSVGTQNRSLTFTYGSNGFVSSIADPMSRTVSFTYTAANRIDTVTQTDGKTTRYTYVDDTEFPVIPACTTAVGGVRIKTIQYPGRFGVTENFYGPGKRVLRQTRSDSVEMTFSYSVAGACVTRVENPTVRYTGPDAPTVDSWENYQAGWRIIGGRIIATKVKNPLGQVSEQRYDGNGQIAETTDLLGQTSQYIRDPNTRLVTQTVDPQGRRSRFAYDARNNLTATVDTLGRLTQRSFSATANQPNSVTAYLDNGTPISATSTYDNLTGRMLTATDPLMRTTSMAYNSKGQMISMTDARGKTSTFDYNAVGDLIKETDPLGHFVTYEYDLSGYLIKSTDALGNSTDTHYNSARQLDKTTDPLGGATTLSFDTRRNLASVTNALGNVIESYQYDQRNRLIQTTDAKGLSTNISYDAAGLVKQITDRASRITTFLRDEKNRSTQINYPGNTSTAMQYDAFERLAKLTGADSTHSYKYDSVDRLIEQTTTANGRTDTIAYQYDALDRLKQRTINGTDITSYAYDNASRLTRIDYRGQTTNYEYDEVSRLTKKTLPGIGQTAGISQEYQYDDASRLTRIIYKKADASVIDQLDYQYDARGSRTLRTQQSSPANTPQETPYAASYDVADRMTVITLKGTGTVVNGAATDETYNLSYDNLGNLISKAKADNSDVTTYTWDIKNRLTGIARTGTNATTATFKYDELGRRIERTVTSPTTNGGQPDTTRFVYDGSQVILEIRNTETASILTGLGVDEVIARYTTAGARTYLSDALGSVIAMSKEDDSITTSYGYSPYGETSQTNASGETTTNANQYTARENDNTGLYFYRARYYDPILKRFISEDPIGLGGGVNEYGYVGGDPIGSVDPSGNVGVGAVITIVAIGATVWAINSAMTSQREAFDRSVQARREFYATLDSGKSTRAAEQKIADTDQIWVKATGNAAIVLYEEGMDYSVEKISRISKVSDAVAEWAKKKWTQICQ